MIEDLRSAVGAPDPPTPTPDGFTLHQNDPNPFNPETTIPFELLHSSIVKLVIYDLSGSTIQTVRKPEPMGPGRHAWTLDAASWPNGAGKRMKMCVLKKKRKVKKSWNY